MVANRQVSAGVQKLWVFDTVVQRGLWWWLLGDVSLEFSHQWLTNIQESEECNTPFSGGALIEDPDNVYTTHGGWKVSTAHTVSKLWGNVDVHPFNAGVYVNGRPWTATAAVSAIPETTNPATISMTIAGSHETVEDTTGSTEHEVNDLESSNVAKREGSGDDYVYLWVRANDGAVRTTAETLQVLVH